MNPKPTDIVIRHETKLPSLANQRLHWAARAKIIKNQRITASLLVAQAVGRTPRKPKAVTLTRISSRPLDGDNWVAAAKGIRDGVADALGIDDGDSRVKWKYEQRKGSPQAVEIRIRCGQPAISRKNLTNSC